MRRGSLSADDLIQRYCALVYAQTGSYQETARRLGLDRRTVKGKLHS
jgi:DNA-binding CsgD family transcriptional regulator